MSSTALQQVDKLLETSKYKEVVETATHYLEKYPRDPKLLMARSTAFLRLGEAQRSLQDAEDSVTESAGKVRADAQLRRAFALKRLGHDSKAAAVLQYASDTTEPSRLELLSQQLKAVTPEPVPEIPNSAQQPKKSTSSEPKEQTTRAQAIRKDWYQSSGKVNVDVYIRDHQDKPVNVTIETQNIAIEAPGVDFKLFLAHPIAKDDSTFTVSPYKFSFCLEKQVPAQWTKLEGVEGQTSTPAVPTAAPVAAPATSPATAKAPAAPGTFKAPFEKNWDLIDDSDDDAAAADPNDFFTQIYKDADPDTRRAMMKSFVESKGTTLSTNWDEVKKGLVEPHPPKDMNIK